MSWGLETALFIVIVISFLFLALILRFTIVERRYRTMPSDRLRRIGNWFLVYLLAYTSTFAWIDGRVNHQRVIGCLFAVLSLVTVMFILAHITNWRGWGRRFQEQTIAGWRPNAHLSYRRPRGWMPVIAALLAPLAIISDLVLLIVLFA